MKKFTLFIASLLIAIGAMAQAYECTLTETQLDATALNEKTEATYIAIKHLTSNPSGYFNGTNGSDFSNSTVFVWEPATENTAGTYYIKNLSGQYMQTSNPKTWGEKVSAATFYAVNAIVGGSTDETNFNGDQAASGVTSTTDTNIVRFVKSGTSTWINIGAGAYNSGKGGWTIYYVYSVDVVEAALDESYVWSADDINNTTTYTVSTEERGSWYSEEARLNGTKEVGVDYNEEDTNQQFAFLKSDNGNYYIYSVGQSKFVSVSGDYTTLTEYPAQTVSILNGTRSTDYPWVFALGGSKQIGVSENYSPDVITFYNDLSDAGNTVRLKKINEEFVATIALEKIAIYESVGIKVQALNAAIAAYDAKAEYIDNKPGYYSLNYDNYETIMSEIKTYSESIDYATANVTEIEEKTATVNSIVESFELNLPTVGKYYRFKHPSEDAYMLSDVYSENAKRLAMGSLDENKTTSIFYYGEDGSLLSYANGRFLPKAAQNGDWTCLPVGSTAPTATFGKGSANGTLGFYLGDDASRAYYSNSKTFVNAGGSFGSNAGYDWVIEEVTELPVTVSAAGVATFYTPVALTIPTNVECYYINSAIDEKGIVQLTPINNVVPAGNGIVIKAGDGTHNFTIGGEATEITDNLLEGTSAATYISKVAYVLANGSNGIGLYKAELNQEDGTAFLNNANKAFFVPSTASGISSYSFNFDWTGTTGIEGVEAEGTQNGKIYDITGREVKAITAPGIYIVNGKKVIK